LIAHCHFFEADHAVFIQVGSHDGRIAAVVGKFFAVEDTVVVAVTLFHTVFGTLQNAFVETLFERKI